MDLRQQSFIDLIIRDHQYKTFKTFGIIFLINKQLNMSFQLISREKGSLRIGFNYE